ncbi:MAG: hypothetical protein HOI96_02955 [Rhodospirillaceae bacterium]|nr:hypothetical protein [Rhodospirillaceae bacterium]
MITEIVSFNRTPGMDRAEIVRDAAGTFDRWTDFPGLVRKMFMRDPDTLATKGIYLWETLEDANKGHDEAWLERAEAHWGNRPTLERYDCFLILENPGGKITECAEG